MASRGQALTVTYVAWDTDNNAGKTGDVGNHTLRWVKDGTSAAPGNSPAEVDATNAPGVYKVTLTAAECACWLGTLCGKSSTANISIMPLTVTFEVAPIHCRINLPARIERATAAEETRAVKVEVSFIDHAGDPVDPDTTPAFRLYNNIRYLDSETYTEVGLINATGIKTPASSFPSWHVFAKHSTGLYYFYWNPLPIFTDAEVYMMVGWEWGGVAQYEYASTTLVTDREDLDAIPTTKTGYSLASDGLDLVTAWTTDITGTISTVTAVTNDVTTDAASRTASKATGYAVAGDAMALTGDERNSVADATLDRAIQTDPTEKEYTLRFAICMMMNSNTVDNAGFLTVYDTADVEVAQLPLTVDADANPVTGVS